MLIPSKFSGYSFDGVRRCFAGGGGGGGGGGDASSAANGGDGIGGMGTGVGDGPGPGPGPGPGAPGGDGTNYVYTPTYTNNRGNTGMNATSSGNTAATTIPSDNLNLRNMAGMRYDQAGPQYNSLLQQGYAGSDIRNALTTQSRPVSDSDYYALVQNAGMTSPTGRPMAGSDQFYQPVYNSSYMNYARPATQFDVSTYGTQPVQSPASASGMSRGNINSAIGNYFQQNPNSAMSDTLNAMRGSGINRTDIQQWGGVNNYGPQMSMPQMQSPFNPYTNSSGYGGFGGGYGGGYMPQMQSPFSYQQQSYQPSYQPQYNPYQMQSPFSYQQPALPPNYGPSQAIVGRSSQMRGTPNVMRRAEGGITSLLDEDE